MDLQCRPPEAQGTIFIALDPPGFENEEIKSSWWVYLGVWWFSDFSSRVGPFEMGEVQAIIV
jgi:hypothetical protein